MWFWTTISTKCHIPFKTRKCTISVFLHFFFCNISYERHSIVHSIFSLRFCSLAGSFYFPFLSLSLSFSENNKSLMSSLSGAQSNNAACSVCVHTRALTHTQDILFIWVLSDNRDITLLSSPSSLPSRNKLYLHNTSIIL